MATARGEETIVELLIKSGANPNYKMKKDLDITFVINAPFRKDEDLKHLKLLKNQTALDIAVQNKNEQLIKIIKNSSL